MSAPEHHRTIAVGLLMLCGLTACAPPAMRAGFAAVDITPSIDAQAPPVWLAGYGQNRRATGVHDPLFARAVVLKDDGHRIALVSVDLVGLMRPAVLRARAALPEFDHVLVSSTHNHEGPDVIGLWGPSPIRTGVDPHYLQRVIDGIVRAVRRADEVAEPAHALYGTADDASLLKDSRRPIVLDPTLRVLRFDRASDGTPLGILVQWNCHPEAMGRRNTLITADFPHATVRALRERHGCPIAYFTGAVGGLMAPPTSGVVTGADGKPLQPDTFEYTEAYGRQVADLADRALRRAQPIGLWPPAVATAEIAVPVTNPIYRLAGTLGVIRRPMMRWQGDPRRFDPTIAPTAAEPAAVLTEVGLLTLGELRIAAIPGELYPELLEGRMQDPTDPGADHPDAPIEPAVFDALRSRKALILGLANDEIGYLIPKRQWDARPPFTYGRNRRPYGEINSVGPDAAPILLNELQRLGGR